MGQRHEWHPYAPEDSARQEQAQEKSPPKKEKEQAKLEPGSRCGLPGEGCVAEHGRSNAEQDNEARAMKQLVRAREWFVRLVRN
jgi:hypothetical protein